jgi:hypothetical protein
MNGNGGIRSRTLADFLNNPEAPPGFVYFMDDEPVIQIDLFEDFYTLFWLGPTNPQTFISSFSHIVDDVKGGPPFTRFPAIKPTFEGFASAIVDRWRPSMVLPSPQQGRRPARFIREIQGLGPSDTRSVYTLKDSLYAFLEPFFPYTVSIQCDLKATFSGRGYRLSLWADTEESKKDDKETGITSNLPLTESLRELLALTCPAASRMPRSDFDQLVRGIRGDIADRRYY